MFSVKLFWIYVLFSFFIWVLVDAFDYDDGDYDDEDYDDEDYDDELAMLKMFVDVHTHENYHLLTSPDECLPIETISTTKIMGGTEARLGEFPWMAALLKESSHSPLEHLCGGSIISSKYVLTAAHCITDDNLKWVNLIVRVGEYDLDKVVDCDEFKCSNSTYYDTESHLMHPDYYSSESYVKNDIGLVRVKGEITFNEFVHPVCLPTSFSLMNENLAGKYVTVAGWGNVATVPDVMDSPILQKVTMPVVNMSLCSEMVNTQTESQLCVGGSKRGELMKDACHGDSGGPLMYPSPLDRHPEDHQEYFVQIGIVAYGPKCNPDSENQPYTTYTKVASYLLWILDNISE